jgi:DNA replication protein DnaC
MDYKAKYNKYKNKYLLLKKIYHGSAKWEEIEKSDQQIRTNFLTRLRFYRDIPYTLFPDKNLVLIMLKINLSKKILYSDEFNITNRLGLIDHSIISGTINYLYWKNIKNNIIVCNNSVKPSDALNSLLVGPSILECATTLMLSLYIYILNNYGIEKFNQVFDKPALKFLLSNSFVSPLNKINNDDIRDGLGNPLHFIFDIIEPSYDNLEENDFVYIEGVKNYGFKHLVGNFKGYNLICKIKDKIKKFTGFGVDIFNKKEGTLTFDEIKKVLVDGYNENQTEATKFRMQKFSDPEYVDTPEYLLNMAKIDLASILQNDKVSIDEEIGGIISILRINKDKLDRFMNSEQKNWFNNPKLEKDLSKLSKTGNINFLVNFAPDTKDATFDTYDIKTELNNELLDLCKKFAFHVCGKNDDTDYPSGCILTGTVGVGKTHLAVSISKYVSQYKKVLFVNSTYFSDKYQEEMIKNKKFDMTQLYRRELFNDIDLIVLDDINSEFGVASNFLEEAIKYIYNYNKSILITSNLPVNIKKCIPIYVDYQDPSIHNIILKNIVAESQRKNWIDNCVGIDKIDRLIKYDRLPSGIIVEIEDITRDSLIEKTTDIVKLINTLDHKTAQTNKIYITIAPFTTMPERVNDLYVESLNNPIFDYVLLYVNNNPTIYNRTDSYLLLDREEYGSTEQLLNVIDKAYDKNLKIILITNSIKKLKENIIITRDRDMFLGIKKNPRIYDRINVIFPNIIN